MICEASMDLNNPDSASELAAHALNWVRLASGDFYRQFPERFKRDGRADRVLLDELTAVRKELAKQDLPEDTIHDLLARIIFAQFLFDRKDSDGNSAINPSLLKRLHNEGTLKQVHGGLSSILADYEEAYRFFRWLNSKFNGDLFPGKGSTETAREAEWRAERRVVSELHLQTLAEFVGGTLKLKSRQRLLWRQYAFDIIPLELISSIYEEFVTEKGAHYTPGFLVDYMLDGVLPWDGVDWDLKVLDPACGSGIFLVKAYQRLIQRWKNANEQEQPSPPVLRRLLERNLFGVDIDEHAVRVASFSLYLTMCDEIDPKNYLRNTKFPRMRGERLIASDFFAEGVDGFDAELDAGSYDLVIGNAPWGKNTATDCAKKWSQDPSHAWSVANKEVGALFIPKAALLTRLGGHISMIQSASAMLFNKSGPIAKFRKQLFSTYAVREVVNLTPLRFDLFKNAVSPPCIITVEVVPADERSIVYISPKQILRQDAEIGEGNFSVIVDSSDVSEILFHEAIDPSIWVTLSWGSRRDWALVNQLKRSQCLFELKRQNKVITQRGVLRGDRKKIQTTIKDKPMLQTEDFPIGTFLYLDAAELPLNTDLETDSRASTSIDAFAHPQMILKLGWRKTHGRFKAVFVNPDFDEAGVFCTKIFVSVHSDNEATLRAALLAYNSSICVYYLLLTSGRFASYRPEPLVEELLQVPIPPYVRDDLTTIATYEEIDELCYEFFSFRDAERVLVEDLIHFTLADFKGDAVSPGRQLTQRVEMNEREAGQLEPELTQYCEYFIRVLKAGFGEDVEITAKIFQEQQGTTLLPVRLAAFFLERQDDPAIQVEQIDSDELCFRLTQLNDEYLRTNNHDSGGIFFQRVARVYSKHEINGKETAVIYIVKPDRVRYWTRSAGLRDGDEIALDVQSWQLDNSPVFDGVDE